MLFASLLFAVHLFCSPAYGLQCGGLCACSQGHAAPIRSQQVLAKRSSVWTGPLLGSMDVSILPDDIDMYQQHTHTYIYINIYVYIHTYIHIYVRTYIQTHIHTHIQTHTCVFFSRDTVTSPFPRSSLTCKPISVDRDTAQFNYWNEATRQERLGDLMKAASLADAVRCDMAMLVLNDVIQQVVASPLLFNPLFCPWLSSRVVLCSCGAFRVASITVAVFLLFVVQKIIKGLVRGSEKGQCCIPSHETTPTP